MSTRPPQERQSPFPISATLASRRKRSSAKSDAALHFPSVPYGQIQPPDGPLISPV